MGEPDSPRVPFSVRLGYAFGSVAGNAVTQAWTLWLLYFYAPPADADLPRRVPDIWGFDARVFLGGVLTAARLLEALDDPLIGYWTDRASSRWGRRLPFVVPATPFWGLSFVLLFLPPLTGASAGNVVYVFVAAMFFYLFSNLAGAPLEALLPTLAKRHEDRLSIATWQLLFGVGGAILGLSVSSLVVDLAGFTAMAGTVAGVAVTVRFATVAAVWQRAKADARPAAPGLRRAIRETFSNPQFLAYLPSFVLFQTGLQMLTGVLPFFVDAVLHDAELFGRRGSEHTGTFTFLLTATVIAGIVTAIPLYRKAALRRGKAWAYRVAMVASAAVFPLLASAGFLPGLPALPQALGAVFAAGMATAGVFLFPNILTADIVDHDAERTGTRREAMFYGTQNMVEKAATAFSPLLLALALLAGDSPERPFGVRIAGPIAGALVALAFVSFRRYSLRPELQEREDSAG